MDMSTSTPLDVIDKLEVDKLLSGDVVKLFESMFEKQGKNVVCFEVEVKTTFQRIEAEEKTLLAAAQDLQYRKAKLIEDFNKHTQKLHEFKMTESTFKARYKMVLDWLENIKGRICDSHWEGSKQMGSQIAKPQVNKDQQRDLQQTSDEEEDTTSLKQMSFMKGQILTLKSEEETITVEWKQGSVLGFGGDQEQQYVLCEYKTDGGNTFPVYVQKGYDIKEQLEVNSQLQYGMQEGVIFFVYHDKEQKPYQYRFTSKTTGLQKFVLGVNDITKEVGIDVSWIAGKCLRDIQ